MKNLKAIILDYDGVCTVPQPFTPIWKVLASKYSITSAKAKEAFLKYDRMYLVGDIDKSKFVKSISNELNISIDEDFFTREFFLPSTINTTLLEAVSKLGYDKIILASNNFADRKTEVENNVGEYFDEIYFSSDLGYTKKESEFFQELLRRNQLRTVDCVFVDDSFFNVNTASEYGIHALYYDSKVNDVQELVKQLEEWLGQ